MPVYAGHRLGCSARAVVVELYRVAGLGRNLGDACAHGARTDHRHLGIACECTHDQHPLNAGVRLFMKALTPSR
ncbi:hypothetical protein D3C78_227050 [compost metagenome]